MTDSTDLRRPQAAMLALDTSTSNMTIALLRDGQLTLDNETEAVRNHSVELMPNIQKLLKDAGLRPSDLTSVAVGQGPGSYTGVRIGVTAAKTFAWSLGIPLYGISSLQAMALGGLREHLKERKPSAPGLIDLTSMGTPAFDIVGDWGAGSCTVDGCELPAAATPNKRAWIVPLMDARRGQAFTALYEAEAVSASMPHSITTLRSDGIRLMSIWLDELMNMIDAKGKEADSIELLFVGETNLFTEQIARCSDRLGGRMTARSTQPHACDIGALAAMRIGGPDAQPEEVHTFIPNYTQLAEAEVKLMKAAKGRE